MINFDINQPLQLFYTTVFSIVATLIFQFSQKLIIGWKSLIRLNSTDKDDHLDRMAKLSYYILRKFYCVNSARHLSLIIVDFVNGEYEKYDKVFRSKRSMTYVSMELVRDEDRIESYSTDESLAYIKTILGFRSSIKTKNLIFLLNNAGKVLIIMFIALTAAALLVGTSIVKERTRSAYEKTYGILQNQEFVNRDDYVKNFNFSAGLKYWTFVQNKNATEYAMVNDAPGNGIEVKLPIGAKVDIEQVNVELPLLFLRNLELKMKARNISSKCYCSILVYDNDRSFPLCKTGQTIIGDSIKISIPLSPYEGKVVNIVYTFENYSEESSCSFILEEIKCRSYVVGNTAVVSNWLDPLAMNELKLGSWSDFYRVERYEANGSLLEIVDNLRAGANGYTSITGLKEGLYRITSKFFGITYGVSDSVLVSGMMGADVRYFVTNGVTRLDVKLASESNTKLSEFFVKVYSQDGKIVLSSKTQTNAEGEFAEDLWVWNILDGEQYENEKYTLKVEDYLGKVVGESKFRPMMSNARRSTPVMVTIR